MRKNILEACLPFVVVVVVMVVVVLLLLLISSQNIFDESPHWIVWQYVIMLNFQLCRCFPPTGCYLVIYQKEV